MSGSWPLLPNPRLDGNRKPITNKKGLRATFAVYANTGLRACIDALQAAYPSVVNVLGEAGFRPLAALFARAHPPADSRMFLHGQGFADHLRALQVRGLATRLSAAALRAMTVVIQVFVYPSAWATHLGWATLLLYLVGRGPGALSLDAWWFGRRRQA